jgi:hypothetical protein
MCVAPPFYSGDHYSWGFKRGLRCITLLAKDRGARCSLALRVSLRAHLRSPASCGGQRKKKKGYEVG